MGQWSPSVGDEIELEVDELNTHDRYAVEVKVVGSTDCVGHVPRDLSKIIKINELLSYLASHSSLHYTSASPHTPYHVSKLEVLCRNRSTWFLNF